MTEPLTPTPTPTIEAPPQPTVDTSYMDNLSVAEIVPKNGSHKCKIASFEPQIDTESGSVTQWRFTLESAEPIADNMGGTIPEGTRLATYGMFMAPSQFTKPEECHKRSKQVTMALNGIVCDPRNDPGYKKANEAYAALPLEKKRPMFSGPQLWMDHELEYYSQWNGTVVLATLNTKVDKNGIVRTNLTGIAAANGPRATKR